MTTGDFNPSKAMITKAEVSNFSKTKTENIVALIGGFSITQSITTPSFSIVLQVADMIGWLEGEREFGEVRGEETIELEIECKDLGTKIFIEGYIVRVDGVQPHSNYRGLIYNLHVISKTSFEAGTKKIIQAFKKRTASDVAQNIFNQSYGKVFDSGNMLYSGIPSFKDVRGTIGNAKTVYFEHSADTLSLATVIPNLTPASALNFIAQRAYSEESKSSAFRFFETITGYYWVTDEWLIKFAQANKNLDRPGISREKQLVFNPVTGREPKDAKAQIMQIEAMMNDTRVDDSADIFAGGYKNRGFVIDLLRGKVTDKTFEYKKNEFTDMGSGSITDDIHSKEWVEKYTNKDNALRFMIYKDYKEKIPGVNKPNQYHTEIVSQNLKHSHHLNYVSATAHLKGRLDIEPGMVVNIKASRFSAVADKTVDNQRLSGNYLVHTTEHVMTNNVLETKLKLVRYMSKQ